MIPLPIFDLLAPKQSKMYKNTQRIQKTKSIYTVI